MKNLRYKVFCIYSMFAMASLFGQETSVSNYLANARMAINDEFYELAETNLQHIFVIDDLDSESKVNALSFKLQLLYNRGLYSEIEKLLADNVDVLKTNSFANFIEASTLYKQGKYDDSIVYIKSVPGYKNDLRLQEVLAWDYVELSQITNAISVYDDIMPLINTNENKMIILNYGKLLYTVKQYEKAEKILQLLKGDENLADYQEGLLLLADVLEKQGKTALAAGTLQEIIDSNDYLSGVRSAAAYSLGDIYADIPNMQTNAILAYTLGIELVDDPESKAQGKFKVANLNLRNNIKAGTIDQVRKVIREYPQSVFAAASQLNLALILFNQGLYDEALLEYQKFLESFDDEIYYAKVYAGMAQTLDKLDRYSEAAIAYKKAANLSDSDIDKAFYTYKEADERFYNNQFLIAQGIYSNLIQQFPDSELVPQASYQVAETLNRQGKYAEAIELLLKLKENCDYQPIVEKIWLQLPQLYIKAGDLQASIDVYTDAIASGLSDELLATAYIGRGELYYRLFEFSSALVDFETVVTMFPNSPYKEKALYMICIVNYWLGNDDISLQRSAAFLKKHPKSEYAAKLKFWMAKLYFNIEEFQKAKTIFIECANDNPAASFAPTALLQAGRCAVRLQKYSEAIEILGNLIKQYPDSYVVPYAYFTQADALTELAKYSEAIVLFDEIINKFPESELKYAAMGRKGDCNLIIAVDDPERYETSIQCYESVANDDDAAPELAFQAAYKIGKTYEKQNNVDAALEQYYENVVLRYQKDIESGKVYDDSVKEWVTLAGIGVADILERCEDWKKVVNILQKVQNLNDQSSEDIEQRIKEIKKKYWWVFY
jgi:tetratricopeptide (TPR) repeat protein